MDRRWHDGKRRRRGMIALRSRRAGRGQAMTEMALIAPLLAIILLGIVEASGAYGAKMDLQQASAQAARTGALEGNGGASSSSCATSIITGTGHITSDPVDRDIVSAVLNTRGINANNISQIQVYDATADGSPYGSAVNTYAPPFITSALSGTQVITGAYYSGSAPGWPSCQRNPDEASDSVAVHITYSYHPITPIFGQASLTMDDQTVQHLNPSQNANPCPIPGIPFPVTAAVATAEPPASASDIITWNQVPSAQGYTIYASVSGGPYTQIYSGAGSPGPNNTLQYTYNGNTTFAPVRYEVAGYNACGTGQSSVPAPDGQCPLPTAPLNLTVADSATPSSHDLTWSAVPDKSGVYGQYTITQTINGATTNTATVTGTLTRATMAYSDPSYLPVQYKASYQSACGVFGPASAPVTATVTPPPAMVVSSTDGQTNVRPGNTLTYTIGFTNTASQAGATAQSVIITDTLPSNVTYNGSCTISSGYSSGSTCTYSGGILTVKLNSNTVGAGNAGSVTFGATVNANAVGTAYNAVTLTSSNAVGHPQAAVSVYETDTIVLPPVMTVSDTDPTRTLGMTQTVTYSLAFTNTASQASATASSVVLTDTFSNATVNVTNCGNGTDCKVNAPYSTGSSCTAPTSSKVVCTISGTVSPGASNQGTVTITAKTGSSHPALVTSTTTMSFNDSGGQAQTPVSTSHTDNIP